MSLVAYGGSSDEFSEDEESSEIIIIKPIPNEIKSEAPIKNGFLGLPPPKNPSSDVKLEEEVSKIQDEEIDMDQPLKFNLPEPSKKYGIEIEEEDDEFLKKKAIPVKPPQRKPVRITIPSLSDFKDEEITVKPNQNVNRAANKLSGLLGMLPKPKSETIFVTKPGDEKKATNLIPHSVMNKSKNIPAPLKKKPVEKKLIANYSDSEESDGEEPSSSDFFSLQVEDKLPEVSMNEINAMVAKKAAKIAETATMFEKMAAGNSKEEPIEEEVVRPQPVYSAKLDEEAMQQLCGVKGKRKRYQEQMNIIDISSSELTNRDEWLRNTLASSTEHQSKKNTSGEDLVPGSKRKHQITYLANQAVANEHELQAMWSQNRQSRRTTQNKYGF